MDWVFLAKVMIIFLRIEMKKETGLGWSKHPDSIISIVLLPCMESNLCGTTSAVCVKSPRHKRLTIELQKDKIRN